MGREHDSGPRSDLGGQLAPSCFDVPGVGPHEHWMIVPAADVGDIDVRPATLHHVLPGFEDVLPVLATARVRVMGGHDESNGSPDVCPRHFPQRVGQKGMPVSRSDVHGQAHAMLFQALTQAVGLPTSELGDGRDTAEELVVLRDFFHALGCDPPTT